MQIGSRRCILNPASGTGDHADYVARRMRAKGFEVLETDGPGDAVTLGKAAGEDDVSSLAVCGGDGTINEVLRGLSAVEHLGDVTLSVVPAGTANLLARNVGIDSLDAGISLADTGETRLVDVGIADGEPFLVSCIAGLPAEASTAASSDLKKRFGELAFLVTGVQEALEFDGLDIRVDTEGAVSTSADASSREEPYWTGEALCVLVGNARRFVESGGQADMEDGKFDIAVVEQMPPSNLVSEAISHRLLGQGTEGVDHFHASELRITSESGSIRFSRDGELATHDTLHLSVRPRTLELRVGPDYDPVPGE